MAAIPPICDFGWKAPRFTLPATDGRSYSLDQLKGRNGTLVAFICNHCPYVKSVIGRLVRDASDMDALGIATIAINANDAVQYPEDGFADMDVFAAANRLPFPYLHDESQAVARAYGAICTPDFFGFNAHLELQYRGRLDASRKDVVPDARRDLYEAMKQVAATGQGPEAQIASMGCSIKWKAG
ncbi:MAG: thioredoxin family protein [Alphaproteobacteria bacterium]|nr:thioredoxin family protein [Alphaproteobacteria bacterium]